MAHYFMKLNLHHYMDVTSKFGKVPLVSLIIVVISPIGYDRQDLLIGFTFRNIDLIFHVTIERFLWSIIPAVCTSGH